MQGAQSGFTLIELMVVLVIVGALVSLVGPSIFKRLDKTKTMAEEKKLRSILEAAKITAFSRKTPILIGFENNTLTIMDKADTPVDSTRFDHLVFEENRIRFNANGFPDKKQIRYITGNGEKQLLLE